MVALRQPHLKRLSYYCTLLDFLFYNYSKIFSQKEHRKKRCFSTICVESSITFGRFDFHIFASFFSILRYVSFCLASLSHQHHYHCCHALLLLLSLLPLLKKKRKKKLFVQEKKQCMSD